MQDDFIGLIGDFGQCAAFIRFGIINHAQRVIRMRRKDHFVELFPLGPSRFDHRPCTIAAHGINRAGQPKGHIGLFQRCLQTRHIGNGPAIDGVPLMLPLMAKQRVVFEKLHHGIGRKVHDLFQRRGPNRARQRQ